MNKIEYLMTCLQEECAEVIQAAYKCNRFAIDGKYPDGKGNLEVLHHELCDVVAIVDMLNSELGKTGHKVGVFDLRLTTAKIEKVTDHMKLSIERGELSE